MPADRAERRRALDPGRSFIVQAPAGSGKTELLSQRFLKVLALVERPERVLAITFTRKATQEMRARITRRLAQAGAGEAGESEYERRAIALAGEVLARDAELGWQLAENPGRLRITTIDGLCLQLLARDPNAGPAWSGVRVLEDARPLHRQAVRQLFDDLDFAGADPAGPAAGAREARQGLLRLLVHLGGDTARLERLLMDMLSRRALWSRRLGASADSMEELLLQRQAHEWSRFERALGPDALSEALEITEALSPVDRRELAGVAAAVEARPMEHRLWRAFLLARLLTTAGLKARKPGGVGRKLFPGIDEAQLPALDRLKEILTAWHETPDAVAALERMASWPPLELAGEGTGPAPELLEDARRILALARWELDAVMAEQGRVDFTAIADAAMAALGKEGAPGDVLLAEDARLEHILMDEFQDSSHAQFRLLRRLTAGWAEGDGRTLFLVGDPMQSIYRFREANVGFFNDVVRRRRIGQVAVEPLRLGSNFRSASEVVDWINRWFPGLFPARDESDSGAVSYTPVAAERGGGGTVRLHPLPADGQGGNEAKRVVELVTRAREELGDPTVAVLVRNRDHAAEIMPALTRAGLVFEAVDMEPLASSGAVRDLLILTRALCHPLDRVAWLALLRAPWCGLRVAEMHAVLGDDSDLPPLRALEEAAADGRLEGDPGERLQRLSQVMGSAAQLAGSRPLARRVEVCWRQLGGPLCCGHEAEFENAETFLDLLTEVEQEGGHEIVERLLERLEKRYAAPKPSRIRLMTIHGAKGLEFDVVIVPALEQAAGGGDLPLIALQEFELDENRRGVLMAPFVSRSQAEVGLYRYLTRIDAERERFERQRLLYVACTRARQQLHLIAGFRPRKDGGIAFPANSFAALLESAFEPEVGAAPAGADQADEDRPPEPPALPLLRLKGPLPALRLGGAESGIFTVPGLPDRPAVALGQALHEWLELIHDHWEAGWDAGRICDSAAAIRASLIRAGAPSEQLDALQDRCITVLKAALASPELGNLLSPAGKIGSWAELALCRREGSDVRRHVIDRLYRDEAGTLHIIDYKSGAADPLNEPLPDAWLEQLQRYRQLVNALGAGPVGGAGILQLESGRISGSS